MRPTHPRADATSTQPDGDSRSSARPLFSVLIPVYNADRFLSSCLKSLEKQTFTDFETVLVDDGSTDRSPAMCDEFAKSNARTKVIHKANQGPFRAREDALAAATGDFIVFLDADDQLSSHALETCGRNVAAHDPDIIWFRYTRREDFVPTRLGGWLPAGVYESDSLSEVRCAVSAGVDITLWGKAFRRSVLRAPEGRNDSRNLSMGEDWLQLLLWFDHARKVVSVEDILYFYRLTPGSAVNNYSTRHADSLTVVFDFLRDKTEKWGTKYQRAATKAMPGHAFELVKSIRRTFPRRTDRLANYTHLRETLLTDMSLPLPQGPRSLYIGAMIWLIQRGHLGIADAILTVHLAGRGPRA